jgi:adenylate kinase family enzyme
MQEFPPLTQLGRRICVTGPSGSGKSTLAVALGRKLGIPAIHLDQLYHQPGTHWVGRPPAEFDRLHAEAVGGDRWVIDGNYSRLIPGRLERASGIIVLRSTRWSSLARYFRRTLFERTRAGDMEGARRRINWQMIRYILGEQPGQGRRREGLLRTSALPRLEIASRRELAALYRVWDLR